MTTKAIGQLRREMREKPLKAAAFGLALLAAVWFWTPLVGRWFGGSQPAPVASNPNTIVRAKHSVAQPGAEQTTTADKPESPGWQQLREWMAADPNMKPTTLPSRVRDPFLNPAAVGEDVAQTEPVHKYITPDEAGINLTSTIVGRNRKTALVDGRPYHEGQKIQAPKADIAFELVDIQPRYVVLENDGKRYTLKVPGFDWDTVD